MKLTSIFSFCSLIFILLTNARYYSFKRTIKSHFQSTYPVGVCGLLEGGKIVNASLQFESTKTNTVAVEMFKGQRKVIFPWTRVHPLSDGWIYNHTKFRADEGKGFYRLFVRSALLNYPISVSGSIRTKNFYGEASPAEYRALQYYRVISLVLFAMCLCWIGLMYIHRRSLVKHHYAIAAVLIVAIFEVFIRCLQLFYINNHGVSSILFDHIEVQFQVIRQALCRLLMIAVSLGWGITLPELTKKIQSVLLKLGLGYYIAASVCEHWLMEKTREHELGSPLMILPFIFGIALVDIWIFSVLFTNFTAILSGLKQEKQYAKYDHYRKFCIALAGLVVLSTINLFCESFVLGRKHWYDYFDRILLFRDCFWHFAFVLMTAIVIVLWRPTKNSKFYAFYVEPAKNENDAELNRPSTEIKRVQNEIDVTNSDIIDDTWAVYEIGEPEEEFDAVDPNDGKRLRYKLDLEDENDNEPVQSIDLQYSEMSEEFEPAPEDPTKSHQL